MTTEKQKSELKATIIEFLNETSPVNLVIIKRKFLHRIGRLSNLSIAEIFLALKNGSDDIDLYIEQVKANTVTAKNRSNVELAMMALINLTDIS